MNYEERYNAALERARELSKTVTGANYEYIFPELKESEDERIRKEIIRIFKGETRYTPKEDADKYVAWLEKQGEQPTDKIAANHLSENPCSNCTNTKGCITCVNGDQKSTSTPRILYSDEVIAWIVANICDFEYYVKLFKQDFKL